MARRPRIQQSEHPYHVCTRTNNKEFRFEDKAEKLEIIKIFAVVLQAACAKYGVKLYHFVLMANHFHMLLKTPNANLSKFMQFVNARVAEKMNKRDERTGHLWGGRFHSTIIESLSQHLKVLQYIYRNPVRAKIVNNPIDYENSTIRFHAFGENVSVTVTEDDVLVVFGKTQEEIRENFIRLVLNEELSQQQSDEIRQAIRSGFYGSEDFKKRMEEQYLQPKNKSVAG